MGENTKILYFWDVFAFNICCLKPRNFKFESTLKCQQHFKEDLSQKSGILSKG